MATLGVVLVLAGLIGLVRPAVLRLRNRKMAVAVLVAGLVITTIAGSQSEGQPPATTPPAPQQAEGEPEQAPPEQEPEQQAEQGEAQDQGQEEQRQEAAADLAEQVLATIGTAPNDDSTGGVGAKLEGEGHVLLGYRFFPVGISELDREIGVDLAPKLREAFEKHAELQKLTVNLYLPYQDVYGNESWELTMRFVFDRDLYQKINWANFQRQDLLKVVKDLERLK